MNNETHFYFDDNRNKHLSNYTCYEVFSNLKDGLRYPVHNQMISASDGGRKGKFFTEDCTIIGVTIYAPDVDSIIFYVCDTKFFTFKIDKKKVLKDYNLNLDLSEGDILRCCVESDSLVCEPIDVKVHYKIRRTMTKPEIKPVKEIDLSTMSILDFNPLVVFEDRPTRSRLSQAKENDMMFMSVQRYPHGVVHNDRELQAWLDGYMRALDIGPIDSFSMFLVRKPYSIELIKERIINAMSNLTSICDGVVFKDPLVTTIHEIGVNIVG